jgi:hypothetical protein
VQLVIVDRWRFMRAESLHRMASYVCDSSLQFLGV